MSGTVWAPACNPEWPDRDDAAGLAQFFNRPDGGLQRKAGHHQLAPGSAAAGQKREQDSCLRTSLSGCAGLANARSCEYHLLTLSLNPLDRPLRVVRSSTLLRLYRYAPLMGESSGCRWLGSAMVSPWLRTTAVSRSQTSA